MHEPTSGLPLALRVRAVRHMAALKPGLGKMRPSSKIVTKMKRALIKITT